MVIKMSTADRPAIYCSRGCNEDEYMNETREKKKKKIRYIETASFQDRHCQQFIILSSDVVDQEMTKTER